MTSNTDRAHGAMIGLAVGDALGMPVRGMSRALIQEMSGQPLPGFVEPSHDHEIEAGGMLAGTVGPSTHEAIVMAQHLIDRAGALEPDALRRELSSDPSSADILPVISNRAAVRCIPLGVAFEPAGSDAFIAAVASACSPTHDSQVAIAGACAVAAAISAAVDGAGLDGAITAAVIGARMASSYGRYTSAPSLAQRLDWALACVDPANRESSIALTCDLIGVSCASQESIPAAFALLATMGEDEDPWTVTRWAASLGGSSDAIAAIVGAVIGAVHGASALNPDAVEALAAANPELNLTKLADDLLAIR